MPFVPFSFVPFLLSLNFLLSLDSNFNEGFDDVINAETVSSAGSGQLDTRYANSELDTRYASLDREVDTPKECTKFYNVR